MKRQLHTLYIKHDGQFKTLSKIALSQLILKIVYLKGDGTTLKQVMSEISIIVSGSVPQSDVEESIRLLIKGDKLNAKNGRHFIQNDYKKQLDIEVNSRKVLSDKVINKYFGKAETALDEIENWFVGAIIDFFELYSFEWFYQVANKGRNTTKTVSAFADVIDSSIGSNKQIKKEDKAWVKQQFISFIDSDNADDNLLFWYYGLSMFSSRLITARNYADKISIDMFRDSMFILDTNILMILDLEEHELNESLKILEKVLLQLNIKPVYFNHTRAEYIKAMDFRKRQTISVFDNYNKEVLESSDCPFIQTALRRHCTSGVDVERMFNTLIDIPSKFNNHEILKSHDYLELSEAIEKACDNEILQNKINETYKKRTGRDKRQNALRHDAGLIGGAQFLRNSEKCWIVTSDSVLKNYAIENCIRNENEIAVGLDVVIGIMAVNSGGVAFDASNFAPLFKNLIKYTLIPESDAFELRDLAFILSTNTRINELSNERVIEVATQVKKMRIAGTDDESISLFLRRIIEGDKIELTRDVQELRDREILSKQRSEQVERERDVAYESLKMIKRAELRDAYDKNLRMNRVQLIAIPLVVAIIIISTFKYLINISDPIIQYAIGFSVELIFGLLPLIPINKRLVRRYSEYVTKIDEQVEIDITNLKNKAKQ